MAVSAEDLELVDPAQSGIEILQERLRKMAFPETREGISGMVRDEGGGFAAVSELLGGEEEVRGFTRSALAALKGAFSESPEQLAQARAEMAEAAQEEELLRNIALANFVQSQGAVANPFEAIAAEFSPAAAQIGERRREERRRGARELFQNLGLISQLRSGRKAGRQQDRRQRLAFQTAGANLANQLVQIAAREGQANKQQIGSHTSDMLRAVLGMSEIDAKAATRKAIDRNKDLLDRAEDERARQRMAIGHRQRLAETAARGEESRRTIGFQAGLTAQARRRQRNLVLEFDRRYPHFKRRQNSADQLLKEAERERAEAEEANPRLAQLDPTKKARLDANVKSAQDRLNAAIAHREEEYLKWEAKQPVDDFVDPGSKGQRKFRYNTKTGQMEPVK